MKKYSAAIILGTLAAFGFTDAFAFGGGGGFDWEQFLIRIHALLIFLVKEIMAVVGGNAVPELDAVIASISLGLIAGIISIGIEIRRRADNKK